MKTSKGYSLIFQPDHHRADNRGYVLEHILVFEQETGISVPDSCCIHHLNGIKDDNRIENLCMMTHSAHTVMHHAGKKHTENTKKVMSEKAKKRFANKRNHPFYKDIDINQVRDLIANGSTVTDACKAFGISKSTFYAKVREQNYA